METWTCMWLNFEQDFGRDNWQWCGCSLYGGHSIWYENDWKTQEQNSPLWTWLLTKNSWNQEYSYFNETLTQKDSLRRWTWERLNYKLKIIFWRYWICLQIIRLGHPQDTPCSRKAFSDTTVLAMNSKISQTSTSSLAVGVH